MNGPDAMPVLTHEEVVEMSGVFVLGALEPADAAAVREHLASCPLDHAEIAELGSVLPVLDASVALVEPRDGLKARILAAAAAEAAQAAEPARAAVTPLATAGAAPGPSPAAVVAAPVTAAGPVESAAPAVAALAVPTPLPTATERAASRSGRAGAATWALRIAAVVAIVALGGWNLLLRNQLDAAQTYQQAVAGVIDVAGQAGSLTAVLTADSGTGTGLAAIDTSGGLTLAMQDLAPTSGSTVYTAWAIGSDGVPVDIGSFGVGGGGTASFSANGVPATAGIVLALTREPASGLTAPTGPVVSKGVATGAS